MNYFASRKLGAVGPVVFPIGLGCMGMSGMYGPTDDDESVRAIHAAIAGGVTLIDTGDFYGAGHNELLIGRALRELGTGAREKLVLSVKFGAMRTPAGAWGGFERATGGGEELSGVFAEPAGGEADRHLPAGAAGRPRED